MFKKSILLIVLFLGIAVASQAQNKAKAEKILNEVSEKMNSYKTIYIEFRNILENTAENMRQESKGNASLKGELYTLNYNGIISIFDGKKNYYIDPSDSEVNITDPNEEEDITPVKFFSFYKKGYNFAWDILQNVGGRKIQYVKLTPIDSKSDLNYVLLGIDTKTKHIYKIIQALNNGTNIRITLTKFKVNIPLSDKLFQFNRKKHEDEGYIINDL